MPGAIAGDIRMPRGHGSPRLQDVGGRATQERLPRSGQPNIPLPAIDVSRFEKLSLRYALFNKRRIDAVKVNEGR
jgi:hypothetical protein